MNKIYLIGVPSVGKTTIANSLSGWTINQKKIFTEDCFIIYWALIYNKKISPKIAYLLTTLKGKNYRPAKFVFNKIYSFARGVALHEASSCMDSEMESAQKLFKIVGQLKSRPSLEMIAIFRLLERNILVEYINEHYNMEGFLLCDEALPNRVWSLLAYDSEKTELIDWLKTTPDPDLYVFLRASDESIRRRGEISNKVPLYEFKREDYDTIYETLMEKAWQERTRVLEVDNEGNQIDCACQKIAQEVKNLKKAN